MNRSLLLAIAALIVGLGSTEAPSQEKDEKAKELRVLFIGNRLTYANDLPKIVEALAESAPKDRPRIKPDQITSAGFMLEQHWKRTDNGSPQARIAAQKRDAVVLQDGVYSTADGFKKYAEGFEKHAPFFHELIDKNGAKTVLFCTATFNRLYPKSFQKMHDLQTAMGKKLKVPVAGTGKAWLTYLGDDSTPEQRQALYSDAVHPSPKGSYLRLLALCNADRPEPSRFDKPHAQAAGGCRDAGRGQEDAGGRLEGVSGKGVS